MGRVRPRVVVVSLVAVLALGAALVAVPYVVLPGAAAMPAAALAAYRSAGSVRVGLVADESVRVSGEGLVPMYVKGSAARNTAGRPRVDARFDRLQVTRTGDGTDVRGRVVDGRTYSRNFGGGGPWRELTTSGDDDLSVAMGMTDPSPLLRFARENDARVADARDGWFGLRYTVDCWDCGFPLTAPIDDGTADTSVLPSAVHVAVTYTLDVRDRPTEIVLTAASGTAIVKVTLLLHGYGERVPAPVPAGASPSPAPTFR
ncbi:hypothetical protein [Actinocatenispora rupis]|uniref:Uncharacterized protein n=1 Tax=Actinocatenispora rupis TaxID=519421 RepID=A0A8J3J7M7_9ACTN|nr:hypothetical protein [Actinocatenispora rupis]GID13141.1 hypothetical protein Aru02nite_40300 [Actinocatenispora rupis]